MSDWPFTINQRPGRFAVVGNIVWTFGVPLALWWWLV